MRVIYYLPSVSFFSESAYGRVAHAIGIINGLAKNNAKVLVIAEEGIKEFESSIDDSVEYHYLKSYNKKVHFDLLKNIDKVDTINADVFLYRKSILGLFWMLCFHLKTYRKKLKVVSEINGLFFDFQQKYKHWIFPFIGNIAHRLLLRADDIIYVVDEDLKKRLSEGILKINASKVIVINNAGPEPELIYARSADSLNLLYFGILSDYNEMNLFIDWMNSNRDAKVKLHIVGDGPLKDDWIQASKNNDNVIFYGYKKLEELKVILKNLEGMTVGVAPYNIGTESGFFAPIKGYYYMSMGFPILYSDLCYKNILDDEVQGKVYQNGNRESLDNGIKYLMNKSNYDRLKANVINGYDQFTWTASMEKLMNNIKK